MKSYSLDVEELKQAIAEYVESREDIDFEEGQSLIVSLVFYEDDSVGARVTVEPKKGELS